MGGGALILECNRRPLLLGAVELSQSAATHAAVVKCGIGDAVHMSGAVQVNADRR